MDLTERTSTELAKAHQEILAVRAQRRRQYEQSVDAISAERRREINLAAKQEREAERAAKSFGLRFERREGNSDGYLRNWTYCIFRRSWNFARYCPTTGKLTIGDGLKVIDADSLPHAIELAHKHEGCAPKSAGPCQQTIPHAPSKRGKKPKKSHRPKNKREEARGKKAMRVRETVYLSDDDFARLLANTEAMADAEEANGVDALSLNRELAGRMREAAADGAKLVYAPQDMGDVKARLRWIASGVEAASGEDEPAKWELN